MNDPEPRFTDEEVDAILDRALEMDATPEARPPAPGGMSLAELKEVAREVGIRPELVERAASEVRGSGLPPAPAGGRAAAPPLRRSATRRLSRRLSSDEVGSLLRVVDDRMGQTGTVSEALGRVRWAGTEARLTTEVHFAEDGGVTRVDVQTSYPARMRRATRVVPGAIATALVVAAASATGVGGAVLFAGAVGAAALGFGVGSLVWRAASREAARRAELLAEEVTRAAAALPPE